MNCIKVKRNNLLNSIYSSVSPEFRLKKHPTLISLLTRNCRVHCTVYIPPLLHNHRSMQSDPIVLLAQHFFSSWLCFSLWYIKKWFLNRLYNFCLPNPICWFRCGLELSKPKCDVTLLLLNPQCTVRHGISSL